MVATDKDAVIKLAMEFGAERLEQDGMLIDFEEASKQFDMFIGMDHIVKMVVEDAGEVVGMIVVFISPLVFSAQVVGQEVVWYVRKDKRSHGVRLLKKVEEVLVKRGCVSIMMIGLEGDASCDFYKRVGYRPFQRTYMKGLV
jgi:GNAT superfamily N-acetyltransferase